MDVLFLGSKVYQECC